MGGFTFIQTLIVLIVIGLITAFVISGMHLYGQTRLFANGIRVANISMAVNEFKAKYNALPGDLGDREIASSFGQPVPALHNCTNTPSNSCRGGNLDGTIGRTDRAIFTALNGTSASDLDQENILFWYHLAAADLFSGIDFGRPTTSTPAFGRTLPISPSRGGYQVKAMGGFSSAETGDSSSPDGLDGLYMIWQDAPFTPSNLSPVVTPHQAAILDRKYDDGKPLTGKIQSRGANTAPNTPDNCRLNRDSYDEKNDSTETCYMIFQIGGQAGF